MPGAILAAIMAASMGNVPLPQKGSTRILSRFHGVRRIRAAARVSVIGALLVNVLYPRLCRDSPAGVNAHRHHIFIEEHPQRIAGSIFRGTR